MNERIRELAERTGLLHKQIGPSVETRHMKKKEQDLEQFAQLIVRECARVQHERFCKEGDVSWELLMQHFGIESPLQFTHAEGCWSWGPAHYECACAEIAKLKGWKK